MSVSPFPVMFMVPGSNSGYAVSTSCVILAPVPPLAFPTDIPLLPALPIVEPLPVAASRISPQICPPFR